MHEYNVRTLKEKVKKQTCDLFICFTFNLLKKRTEMPCNHFRPLLLWWGAIGAMGGLQYGVHYLFEGETRKIGRDRFDMLNRWRDFNVQFQGIRQPQLQTGWTSIARQGRRGEVSPFVDLARVTLTCELLQPFRQLCCDGGKQIDGQ